MNKDNLFVALVFYYPKKIHMIQMSSVSLSNKIIKVISGMDIHS